MDTRIDLYIINHRKKITNKNEWTKKILKLVNIWVSKWMNEWLNECVCTWWMIGKITIMSSADSGWHKHQYSSKQKPMVLILDGNSEQDPHVWRKLDFFAEK